MKAKEAPVVGWTPRELIHLFYLVVEKRRGARARHLLAQMRARLLNQECRPRTTTAEWDWRANKGVKA